MGLKHSQLKQLKKATFLDTIELFKIRSGSSRRGFNDFILAALKEMRAYEVEDDLEAYKALLSVLPRGGRLKATSILHADVGAYMQQQATVTRLLLQLNANREIQFEFTIHNLSLSWYVSWSFPSPFCPPIGPVV